MIYFIPLLVGLYLVPIKKEKTKYLLMFSLLLIFTIIRYGVGADYFSYKYIYENTISTNIFQTIAWNQQYEPLFKLLMAIFKNFGLNYEFAVAIFNGVLFTAVSIWIYRNSKKPTLSLLMYSGMFFLVWSLSAYRQSVPLIVGLFIFYDKKRYSIKTQIFAILFASLFHYSGLFLFFILIFDLVTLNKKRAITLIATSVLFSILPFQLIIEKIPIISSIAKISTYNTGITNILSFGYIVRLSMAIIIIIFYDKFTLKNKKIVDHILFGFSTYFILSFAPIIAGRLAIYTYILVVILIPNSITEVKIQYQKIGILMTVAFSSLYMYKEINTLVNQAGMNNNQEIPTIFNKDKYTFDNYSYYLLESFHSSEKDYDDFILSLQDKEPVGYDENLRNFIEWNPLINSYSLYNIEGNLSVAYEIKGNPKVFDDVLVNYFDVDKLFKEVHYTDLSEKDRNSEELIKAVTTEEELRRKSELYNQTLTDIKFEDVSSETQAMFDYPDKINEFTVYKIEGKVEYYIAKVGYYNDIVYLYLKDDLSPIVNKQFNNLAVFDHTDTIQLVRSKYMYHINLEGEIIWIRKQ